MGLGVNDHLVIFLQDKVSFGNQHLVFSLDQNDKGLAGNVQIPDGLSIPGVVCAEDDFLEINVFIMGERFGSQNQRVAGLQRNIAAGNDDLSVSLDGRYNNLSRKSQVLNGFSLPAVAIGQMDFNEMHIFFLGVFTDTFDAQQPKNPDDAEHTECHCTSGEKDGQVVRQERKYVDDTGEREKIGTDCLSAGKLRVGISGRQIRRIQSSAKKATVTALV